MGGDESPADPVAPAFEADYFTDPLCCWSWAFESQRQRLQEEFGPRIDWRLRMGGMLAGWDRYHDPVNCISRPLQMGPLWFQVRHTLGVELDDGIWFEDPPASSYPSCIAVKAAQLQSAEASWQYLARLREAVMRRRQNIARREVLLAAAEELANEAPEVFDALQFERDVEGPAACESFREDLRMARYLDIGRFPTLLLRRARAAGGIAITGYRPYDVLRAAMENLERQAAAGRGAKN